MTDTHIQFHGIKHPSTDTTDAQDKHLGYQFWKLQSQLTKDKMKLAKLQEKLEQLKQKEKEKVTLNP